MLYYRRFHSQEIKLYTSKLHLFCRLFFVTRVHIIHMSGFLHLEVPWATISLL